MSSLRSAVLKKFFMKFLLNDNTIFFLVKPWIAAGALTAATAGAGLTLYASDYNLHPPKYDWNHSGPLESLDHAR